MDNKLYIPIDTSIKKTVECQKLVKRGETLELIIRIFTNGALADLTGESADIILIKSDGTRIERTVDATNIANGTITVKLDQQPTLVAGLVTGEVQIYKDGSLDITNNFTYIVDESLADDIVEISKDDIQVLADLRNLIISGEITIQKYENLVLAIGNSIEAIEAITNIKSYIDIKLPALENANAQAVVNIANETTKNTEAEQNINDLDSKNAIATNNISDLDSKNLTASSNINALDTKNSTASQNISDLDSKNSTASSNISSLNSKNTEATTNKSNLDSANTRAEANISALNNFGDATQLAQDVNAVKTEVETARGTEANLDARLDKFDTSLSDIVINVKNFGAKGDGITDDTTAINLAMQTIKNTGGTLYFPNGTYVINSTLSFDYTVFTKDINILGNGRGLSQIWLNQDVTGAILHFNYVNGSVKNISLKGFKNADNWTDYQNHSTNSGIGISNATNHFEVENCEIVNCRSNGISSIGSNNLYYNNNYIHACYCECILASVNGVSARISNNVLDGGQWGIDSNVIHTEIRGNIITNCATGITFENMSNGVNNTTDAIIENNLVYATGCGINVSTQYFGYRVDNVQILNNTIKMYGIGDIGGVGIHLDKVTNVTVKNNLIQNCKSNLNYPGYSNGIYVEDAQYLEISNNNIRDIGRFGIALKDQSQTCDSNSSYIITHCTIKNNVFTLCSAAAISSRNSVDYLTIQNNLYKDSGGSFSAANSITHYIIENNDGYNTTVTNNSTVSIVTLDKGLIHYPTLLNSWVNRGGYLPVGYFKDSAGVVHLQGHMASGTINQVAFKLPVGYRPSISGGFPASSNNSYGNLWISSTGDVTPNVGSSLDFSLNGISFMGY